MENKLCHKCGEELYKTSAVHQCEPRKTISVERLEEIIEEYDYIERCSNCDGVGHLGKHTNGKLISCEACGGHEDALGRGFILNDINFLAKAIKAELGEM